MEFVTPEEIADVVARELQGGNTGHDVINALDNAVMGPTYRAGLMRHWALEKLRALEKEHGVRSVAFENLGPPRLSKLLYEADLLAEAFDDHGRGARGRARPSCRARTRGLLREDPRRRSEIVSIGIPILLPDGRLLRGPECKIPPVAAPDRDPRGHRRGASRPGSARAGWTCARPTWPAGRSASTASRPRSCPFPPGDSSSRFLRDRQFWGEEGFIQPGKIVGWIFATEDKGARMK